MRRSDRGSGSMSSLGRPASLRKHVIIGNTAITQVTHQHSGDRWWELKNSCVVQQPSLRVQMKPAALSAVDRARNPRGIKCAIPPCSKSLRNYHLVSFRMPTKKNSHNYPIRQLTHSSPFPPPYLCDARFSTQTTNHGGLTEGADTRI